MDVAKTVLRYSFACKMRVRAMNKDWYSIAVLSLALSALTGCSSPSSLQEIEMPSIEHFTPSSILPLQVDTIYGRHFLLYDTMIASVGGASCYVGIHNDTMAQLMLPINAVTAPIDLHVGSHIVSSATNLTVLPAFHPTGKSDTS